jgi:outer membrane biosynthesis protein TonB
VHALTADEAGGGHRALALLLGVSIAAHVAMFGGLGRFTHGAGAPRRRPPVQVTMEVAPPRPAPPPPVAEKASPPAPRAVARKVVARAPEPAAPPPPPAAEPEAPADFSGVTLTNDGPGPGWASAVGNGASMRGPLGRPGARGGGTAPAERPAGPPVVELGSLSRPPAPPDLADVLERHYPEVARRQGLAGQAILKARITPEGRARDLVLISQTMAGFGDACRATLRDSIWTAPLDREGRAVATFVTYTCRFEISGP